MGDSTIEAFCKDSATAMQAHNVQHKARREAASAKQEKVLAQIEARVIDGDDDA